MMRDKSVVFVIFLINSRKYGAIPFINWAILMAKRPSFYIDSDDFRAYVRINAMIPFSRMETTHV